MREKGSTGIISGIDLLSLIEADNKQAFTDFYSVNFRKLVLASEKYVQDVSVSEEIVQDVFMKMWEERTLLYEVKSVQAYLYRSVINASINFVQRQKNIERHHLVIADQLSDEDADYLDELNQLVVLLYDEIELLPEKCRLVFKMSRFEGLKYKDIALQLGISEKTVENHMGNALKTLRFRMLQRSGSGSGGSGLGYLYFLSTYLY